MTGKIVLGIFGNRSTSFVIIITLDFECVQNHGKSALNVVPLVTSLSTLENGIFVSDYTIVSNSSKFSSIEIRTTLLVSPQESNYSIK